MLQVQNSSAACHSCRLRLAVLFEHGFSRASNLQVGTREQYRSFRGSNHRAFSFDRQSRPLRQTKRLSRILRPETSTRTYSKTTRSNAQQSFGQTNGRELPQEDDSQQAFNAGPANVSDEVDEGPIRTVEEELELVARYTKETFGDGLPKDLLSEEEYRVYERLFGPPVREISQEEEEDLLSKSLNLDDEDVKNLLFRQTDRGELEEVDYSEDGPGDVEYGGVMDEEAENGMSSESDSSVKVDNHAMSQIEDEYDDVDREMEEDEEENEDEEEENEDDEPGMYSGGEQLRSHPSTRAGRSGTYPSTIALPKLQFIEPISELLTRVNFKHLSDAAEKAFGGPGLPHSSATPGSMKHLPQRHIGLEPRQNKMTEVEADAYIAGVMPGVYSAVMHTLVEIRKRLGTSWIRDLLLRNEGEGPRILDAGAGGAGVIAWREILRAEWALMREEGIVSGDDVKVGKSTVLTGPTTLRHRVSRFLENTTFLPRLPDYVHSANPGNLLHGAPAQGRKSYDIIIAPHTLFPLKEDFRRRVQLETLWALLEPNGGVLVLIEKGLPRGFEAIAEARAHLLKHHIASAAPENGESSATKKSPSETTDEAQQVAEVADPVRKEPGMIVAPCTNHSRCPMYLVPGLSTGRKDFCHFSQRFIRPPFLQRLMDAKRRNHEDVKFSYVAVRRGVDLQQHRAQLRSSAVEDALDAKPLNTAGSTTASTPRPATPVQGPAAADASFAGFEALPPAELSALGLPRVLLSPLKRRGHVSLDVCTAAGRLERWTVPRSFSAQAYRDARKARWGDLWALGAKTRSARTPRLGRAGRDPRPGQGDVGVFAGRRGRTSGEGAQTGAGKGRRGGKGAARKAVFHVEMGAESVDETRVRVEEGNGGRNARERRSARKKAREPEEVDWRSASL